MKRLLFAFSVAGCLTAFSAELFVDRSGAGGAYTTIQAAVDAASPGDTITVAPGDYSSGSASYTWSDGSASHTSENRIHINKRLYLRSSGGREQTSVYGNRDRDNKRNTLGVGPNAVRCVYVTAEAAGTVIEGFTFLRGSSHDDLSTGETPASRAGGVCSTCAPEAVCVVDCAFDTCTATHAAAVYGVTAVRCRFYNNQCIVSDAIAADSVLVHSLCENNAGTGGSLSRSTVVNGTFVANGSTGAVFGQGVKLFNGVVTGNGDVVLDGLSSVGATEIGNSVVFSASPTETADYFIQKDAASRLNASPYQLFAPLYGDYRILAGSEADGIGSAERLADVTLSSQLVTPVNLYRDFNGTLVRKAGTIQPGCIQEAVRPAGGAIQFNRAVVSSKREGGPVPSWDVPLWAYSETPQEVVRFARSNSQTVFIWTCLTSGERLAPSADGSLWCVMPPAGLIVTNTVQHVAGVYYVDPASTAETPDGSQQAPYKTIQNAFDALDALPSSDNGYLVYVAECDCRTGGFASTDYGNARIRFPSKNVRVVGAGAGRSVIVGAYDQSSFGEANQNRGPDAYRCVLFRENKIGILQGFTLCEGRSTGYDKSGTWNLTDDKNANAGGLALGFNSDLHVVADCTLRDGAAFRGSVAKNVNLLRCRISECASYGGACVRPGKLDSSVLYVTQSQGGYIVGENLVTVLGSTLVTTCAPLTSNNDIVKGCENCIFYGAGTGASDILTMGTGTQGCLYWNVSTPRFIEDQSPDVLKGDPRFVDRANGDFRLMAASEGFSAGKLTPNYWKGSQTDVDGNPRVYRNGRPLPGALQKVVPCVTVVEPQDPTDCTVSPTGYIALEPGESVTVTAAAGAGTNRELRGFLVDGQEVLSSPASYTYTAPADGSYVVGGVRIEPSVTAHWYVSPTGDDTASGWSTNAPMRTLTQAMFKTRSGDTVHALPGVYAEGLTNANLGATSAWGEGLSADPQTLSRVFVPAGVTLVGDEGAERTVILGRCSDAGLSTDYGCGSDAARCVTLAKGASVRGFTLAGGRSGVGSNDGTTCDDRNGAAVLAYRLDNANVIADCIISNNVSARAVVHGGKIVNCRVVENRCGQTGCGACYSSAYGSYFAGNLGNNQVMRFCGRLENCTIGKNNEKTNSLGDPYGPLVNCVVLCTFGTAFEATNCVFLADKYVVTGTSTNISTVVSVEGAKLDARGVPERGSPLVDAGSLAARSDALPPCDSYGVRRLYNGAPDIGAYEYDWRGDYAAKLGLGVTVTEASSNVTMCASGVLIPAGQELSATLAGEAPGRSRYSCAYAIGDGATLALSVHGQGTEMLTESGERIWKRQPDRLDLAFAVSGAPGDSAVVTALGSIPVPGIMIIFR